MANENKRIEAIYHLALEKKNKKERSAYLDSACGDDSKLRASVEGLLQAHDKAGDFLEVPPFDPAVTLDTSPLTEGPGTTIGNYKLLEQIGEGGMAVVYMAEQEKPLRRRVALKIIKLGMDTKSVIARFEVERQALAVMDHPNIAKVFDAGTTETGRPYFVMELVRGVSISKYCDKNKLDTKERLDLFVQVCNAVQHAHQKGIIHRDIKPSNVMVTLHDGKPVPKVIDFGIAKATGQKLTEKTLFTRYAQMIGTPAYMSPEQAEMSGLDVDTRTDIYSLGVLLYELLTAATPFSEEQLREAGYLEMQRIIREEEPDKPSTKLSTLGEELTDIAEHRKTSPDLLQKLVRGDLDWIVMKSLEKDRTRRYDTVIELAADVGRHLNSEPVQAAAPSVSYRLRKFIRRNRVGVMVGCLVALVVLVALSVLSVSTWMISREQARTQEALEREQQAAQLAKKAQAEEVTARKVAQEQQEEAVRQRDAAYQNLYVAQMRLAPQYWEAGQIITLKEMLEEYLPKPGQADLRGWEWYYLLSLCHKDLLTLRGHNTSVRSVVWSPDGQRIASSSSDSTVKVWDATSGKEQLTLTGHTGRVVVAWSPDGKFIATGSGDKAVRLWDATTGEELSVLRGHTGGVSSIAWSPDGSRIASGSDGDKTIKVWDAATGRELLTLRGHISQLRSISWSPDGKHLATGTDNGWVKIWEVRTGQDILSWRAQNIDLWAVAWSPDGIRLTTGGYASPRVKIWEADTGKMILSIQHDAGVEAVVWSPDGKQIASATRSQRIRIWDANTGQEVLALRGHTGWVTSVAWSHDGKRLASGGTDHTVKVWDACADQRTLTLDHTEAKRVTWSPKGNLLVSAGGGEVKIWNLGTGHEVRSWHTQPEDGQWVTWSPNGKWLASGLKYEDIGQKVKIWDVETGKEMATAPVGCRTNWSPDSRFLAIACGKTIKIWDLSTKKTVLSLRGHIENIWAVSWSPDGKQLASAGWDGLVMIWDAATGKNLLTFRGHRLGRWIASVTWSPDSKRLASGGWDQIVKVWDTDKGCELLSLRGHTGAIFSVAWSPDGRRLVSGSTDQTVKVWDAATGQELLTLRGHSQIVRSVAWSSDGKRLAAVSKDGTVRVWDASLGYRFQEALEAFGKAQELDPKYPDSNQPESNNNLAWILATNPDVKLRDPARAVELAQKAVEAAPAEATFCNTLGVAHYRAGHWKEAIEALDKSIELGSSDQDSFDFFFLAMAHWQLGNKGEACQWYDRAVEWMEQNQPGNGELARFRAEAAELLGVSEPTDGKEVEK